MSYSVGRWTPYQDVERCAPEGDEVLLRVLAQEATLGGTALTCINDVHDAPSHATEPDAEWVPLVERLGQRVGATGLCQQRSEGRFGLYLRFADPKQALRVSGRRFPVDMIAGNRPAGGKRGGSPQGGSAAGGGTPPPSSPTAGGSGVAGASRFAGFAEGEPTDRARTEAMHLLQLLGGGDDSTPSLHAPGAERFFATPASARATIIRSRPVAR